MSENQRTMELPPRLELYKNIDDLYKSVTTTITSELSSRSELVDDNEKQTFQQRLEAIQSGEENLEVWLTTSNDYRKPLRGASAVSVSHIYPDSDKGSGTYYVYLEASDDTPDNDDFSLPTYPKFSSTMDEGLSGADRTACVVVSAEMQPYIVSKNVVRPLEYKRELEEAGEPVPYLEDEEAADLINILQNSIIDTESTIADLEMDKPQSPSI